MISKSFIMMGHFSDNTILGVTLWNTLLWMGSVLGQHVTKNFSGVSWRVIKKTPGHHNRLFFIKINTDSNIHLLVPKIMTKASNVEHQKNQLDQTTWIFKLGIIMSTNYFWPKLLSQIFLVLLYNFFSCVITGKIMFTTLHV